MKTIHKYRIEISCNQEIELPAEYEVIHVGLDPFGIPSIWAIVDPFRVKIWKTVRVFGTGHEIPESVENRHIGSFVQGPYVWHVFIDA